MEPKLNRPVFPVILAGLSCLALVCVLVWGAYVTRNTADQARAIVEQVRRNTVKNTQARTALCAFKSDLEKRHSDSIVFLKLTPEQRVLRYGEAFGNIPDSVIRSSAAQQAGTLRALELLRCS